MDSDKNRVEGLVEDVASYVNLKIDSVKLGIVESLATMFSSMLGVLLFVVLASQGLLLIAAALTYGLSLWIGSMVWALVIVGILFLLVALLLFLLRERLIVNSMVRMFIKMLFRNENREDDDEFEDRP